MDIRVMLNAHLSIIWNKPYDVRFADNNDRFTYHLYHFSEGMKSGVLMTRKNSKYCGIEMPTIDLVFKYYTCTVSLVQQLLDKGIISFV